MSLDSVRLGERHERLQMAASLHGGISSTAFVFCMEFPSDVFLEGEKKAFYYYINIQQYRPSLCIHASFRSRFPLFFFLVS